MSPRSLAPLLLALLLGGCVSPAAPVPGAGSGPGAPPDADMGWLAHAPGITARSEVAAGQVESRMYVVGGFAADGTTSRKVEVYDAAADAWSAAPDLPVGIHHTAVVGVGQDVFVFGGATGDAFLATPLAYKLSPGAPAWVPIAPLVPPRWAHAAAAVGQKVYVVGGVGPDLQLTSRVDVYDTVLNTWSTAPDLPTPRDHLTAVALDHTVVVLGGDRRSHATDLDVVEAFDASRGQWASWPAMPVVRGAFAAAAWRGQAVVMGGENDTEVFPSAFAFDPARATWSPLPDMITPRHGFGAGAWGDRVYVLLGAPQPGLAVTPSVESLGPHGTGSGVGVAKGAAPAGGLADRAGRAAS